MNRTNYVWLIVVIILIIFLSLWYTSTDNQEPVAEAEPTTAVEATDTTILTLEPALPIELTTADEAIEWFNYFEHTAPGDYSEVFVEITGFQPNVQKIVYLRNADTGQYIEGGGQDLTTTELGHISTRFRITAYGNYEAVSYDENAQEIVSPLIVVN